LNQVEKTVSQVTGTADKFIIPNVGHTPHKESPEIVLNRSIEFINSVIN
jgi:pimeloyl-ACP methyl ester carboxylesterase